MVLTERKTKAERREEILDAAVAEFAAKGLHGASTDEIARLAGISQPYVFRLFGTKKELYMAVVARCFRQTLEIFQRAAEGKRGEDALAAIGLAYGELLQSDRIYLRAQMQAYAACEDPEICAVVRARLRRPRELRRTGRRQLVGGAGGVLLARDAHERPLLDGRDHRGLGREARRGLQDRPVTVLFFSFGGK